MGRTVLSKPLHWQTETRVVADLIPTKHNPRKLTDKQREDLTSSIEKFDLAEIPAVNLDNSILAGHQRIQILHLLGRGGETIDVRIPNRKLTKAEADEYLIRSNRNTGEWDFDVLNDAFAIEDLVDWGFQEWEIRPLSADRINDPDAEWTDMPDYENEDQTAWKILKVHFQSVTDLKAFARLVDQSLSEDTRFIWYPKVEELIQKDKVYTD